MQDLSIQEVEMVGGGFAVVVGVGLFIATVIVLDRLGYIDTPL